MRAFANIDGYDEPTLSTNADVRCRTAVVVDDDDELRFVCSEALRAGGFLVSECATLFEAFATLEERTPDIVLLDRELPDGSGLELARWLRRKTACSCVRIVAFSGRTSSFEANEALQAGCDAFVAKPCAPRILLENLESLLATVESDNASDPLPRRETR